MSFAIDDKIVGVFFLGMQNQDWMCYIREIEPEQQYEVTYRIRFYEDDKAFDSQDRKKWTRGIVPGTRAFVIAGIREAVSIMRSSVVPTPQHCYEVMNDSGDFEDFYRRFVNAPFVYVRVTKPDDAATDSADFEGPVPTT